MVSHTSPVQAVLLTGGLGTGKTSVAIEMGEALERAGAPFAVIDLDWLCWAWTPALADQGVHELLCANLHAVVPNMLDRAVRYLVLARTVLTAGGLDQLRDAIAPIPLHVIRLTTEDEQVVGRLRARDSGPRLHAHLSRRTAFLQMTAAATPTAIEVDTTTDDAATVAASILRDLGWPSAADQ